MKPKIALVGVGKFGKNHLRVLTELDEAGICKFVGVADVNKEVLQTITNPKIKLVKDYRDFLVDKDVDALDIVTPADTHFRICEDALAADKHVFTEKPLATCYMDGRELVRMATKHQKTLMVGHIFRYNFAVRMIKELIEKKELGKIYCLFGHLMDLKPPRTDVGALLNFTVHHIDIYNFLLDALPQQVSCNLNFCLGRRNFEDYASLILQYPGDVMAVVEGSWLVPKQNKDLIVVGSQKSVSCDLMEQTVNLHHSHIDCCNDSFEVVKDRSDLIRVSLDEKFKEPLKLELTDFIDSINTRREPLANGESSLNVIRITERALESARLKRSVPI